MYHHSCNYGSYTNLPQPFVQWWYISSVVVTTMYHHYCNGATLVVTPMYHQHNTSIPSLIFFATKYLYCTNPSGSFAHCCHHYFISDIFDLLDHQLTWAPGCQVGPFRSHSGWSLSLPLPPRFLHSPSFPPLFNLPCHRIPTLAQTSTMAVVSARICFPHAPPLFLLPPLSLIKVPCLQTLQSRDNGLCPALRCPAQGQMGGWSQQTPQAAMERQRKRAAVQLTEQSSAPKSQCFGRMLAAASDQDSFCFRQCGASLSARITGSE